MSEMYLVEIFKDNKWEVSSSHRNRDHASINGSVISNSRNLLARVVSQTGDVLQQFEPELRGSEE